MITTPSDDGADRSRWHHVNIEIEFLRAVRRPTRQNTDPDPIRCEAPQDVAVGADTYARRLEDY